MTIIKDINNGHDNNDDGNDDYDNDIDGNGDYDASTLMIRSFMSKLVALFSALP